MINDDRFLPKWLIVSKHSYGASVEIGLKNSLDNLHSQGKVSYQIKSAKDALASIAWADVVVFVRAVDEEMKRVLHEAKQMKKQTLYYVDDWLYELPIEAREWSNYNTANKREGIAYFIDQTDCLVTCSDWLTKRYEEQFGVQGVWVQPAIKEVGIKGMSKKDRPLVIGVAASSDYARILQPLKSMFISLKEKYQEKIQFEFFGPKVTFLEEVGALYYSPLAYDWYEILMARRQWDIGIAYNQESHFTGCKFYNKYLEYARLGIPGIYSDITLFRKVITHQVNGILVENTCESWTYQMEHLINQPSMREQIKQTAYDEVIKTFSIEQGSQMIETQLARFL